MSRPKNYAIVVGFIIFISAAIMLSVLVQESAPSPAQFTSAEDAVACYSSAAEVISKNHNIRLMASTNEIIKTKENVFQTTIQQDITYQNWDSGDLQMSVSELIDMRHHTLQASAVYSNGTVYYSLNDNKFTGNYNTATLSAQYPPPIILDPNAYQNINGFQVGNSTVIYFRVPTQPERWTGIENAVFQDAWGSAWMDNNGNLLKSTYNLCYTKGELTFYRSVTVRVMGFNPDPIRVPTDLSNYTSLSDPMLPRQLEVACGYLMQSQNIEANHTDKITCEIFGDTRLQSIDVSIRNNTDNPFLKMTTAIEISNNSREGEILTSQQVQQYHNGNYTLTTNNGSAITEEGISSKDLLNRCQEILIGTILLPQYVQGTEITFANDTYRVVYSATNEFAQKVVNDACMALYNEPQLLDELTTEHRIEKVLCYLEFNKDSGLPTNSGIHLLGTYYVGELPYQLIFESDQTYLIP